MNEVPVELRKKIFKLIEEDKIRADLSEVPDKGHDNYPAYVTFEGIRYVFFTSPEWGPDENFLEVFDKPKTLPLTVHIIDVRCKTGKFSIEATIEPPEMITTYLSINERTGVLSYETSTICCDVSLDEIYSITDIWFQGNIQHRRVIYRN